MVNRFLSQRIKVEIFQKERDKMKKEELNEYGYPINKDSDKKIRQGMDFGTWVGLILILIMIIWWVLKLVGII